MIRRPWLLSLSRLVSSRLVSFNVNPNDSSNTPKFSDNQINFGASNCVGLNGIYNKLATIRHEARRIGLARRIRNSWYRLAGDIRPDMFASHDQQSVLKFGYVDKT